jgi:hypothetical protein
MARVVLALEVLGLLLLAAGAGVGLFVLVGLWAALLAAGVVVLAGAARGQKLLERPVKASR